MGSRLCCAQPRATAEMIAANSVVDTNQYGAALPRVVSKSTWVESFDQVPSDGIPYREWLCCLPSVYWDCDTVSCEPIDPFEGQRRWSPRRDHAAATIRNAKLFVLGGRARALENIPASEAIGGIVIPGSRLRERSILMSDVWMSLDGDSWTLITPGCYVHQPGIVILKGLGVQKCTSTTECWVKKLGATRCNSGVCECTMWSPREQHAAAAVGDALYVMGGLTYVPAQQCGGHRCGTEYTRYLDDVWRSEDDGRSWEQIKPLDNGQWTPRAGFGLALAGGFFWLAGGRSGERRVYDSSVLFNDVWRSSDGITWTMNMSSAPWTPRTNLQLVANGELLLLVGGAEYVMPSPSPSPLPFAGQVAAAAAHAPAYQIRHVDPSPSPLPEPAGEVSSSIRLLPLNDLWTYDLGATSDGVWVKDFGPSTIQSSYVSLNSTLASLMNLTALEDAALSSVRIRTVYQLALASGNTIRDLRLGRTSPAWPNPDQSSRELCYFHTWATVVYNLCRVVRRPFDGEFIRGITFLEGSVTAATLRSGTTISQLVSATKSQTTLEQLATTQVLGGTTGCEDRDDFARIPYHERDAVCAELPSPRYSHSAAEMDGRVYVLGGYEERSKSSNDVWYRDPVLPSTVISKAPRSGSSDTVFEFSCTEPACIYEWRIFEVPSLDKATVPGTGVEVRNWSKQLPPVDVISFIRYGYFRIEVRAIDPAGNRDLAVLPGTNVIAWQYVPPIPWGWIILGIFLGVSAIIFAIYYYRRWRRRRAMELYAMKRIQRKIKAVQEGDWRNFYDKGKKGKKGGKSKKREERERRAKEGGNDSKRKRKGAGDKKKKKKSKDSKKKKGAK
jgi:hypothetical protein